MAKRDMINLNTEEYYMTTKAVEGRSAVAGPTRPGGKNRTSDILHRYSADNEFDKQMFMSMGKKAAKDAMIIEGKINIFSQIEGEREVLCCKYNEDFDSIAGGFSDGIIRAYAAATGEKTFTLTDADVKDNRAPITSIQHRPVLKHVPVTNCLLATYANGCVKCWSYNFNQCLYTIKEKRQTFGLCYHPRFPKFATYGDDSKIYFYDEETKTQERILAASEDPEKHDGHMSRVFAGKFHPRNNYELITGGWDDVVQFWDLRQPYAIRHLSGVHMCGEGIDINPKGTEVLTCAFQMKHPLQLWDYGSGKLMHNMEPDIFPSKLYCGRYLSKDFIMTGGADPNLVRVVDLQTTTTSASITFLPGAVYALDVGRTKGKANEKFITDAYRVKSDITTIPKSAFISSKKIYQVEPTMV